MKELEFYKGSIKQLREEKNEKKKENIIKQITGIKIF
jgi:hypothetical protein